MTNQSASIADTSWKGINGLVDGIYTATSMVLYAYKLTTDSILQANLQYADSYSDNKCLPILLTEMIVVVVYAYLGQWADQENALNTHPALYWIIQSWPYIRDALSGLKNGYDVIIILACFMAKISITTIHPIGLSLGVIYAAILITLRVYNKNLNRKNTAPNQLWLKALDAVDGVLDGVYLFSCLIVVMGFALPNIITGLPMACWLAAMCTLTIISVAARIDEKYSPANNNYSNHFLFFRALLCGYKNARSAFLTCYIMCTKTAAKTISILIIALMSLTYAIAAGCKSSNLSITLRPRF